MVGQSRAKPEECIEMVKSQEIVERVTDRVEGLAQWVRTSGLHPQVVKALLMNIQDVRDDLSDLRASLNATTPTVVPVPVEQPKVVVDEKKNPKPAAKAPVFQK